MVPDDDDLRQFLQHVELHLVDVKARPEAARIIAARTLTDDDVRFLIAFSMEAPYPLYRWLNGHLMAQRRDPAVVDNVGPFFQGWHAAYDKLERVERKACRSAVVGSSPALRATFDDYEARCAHGQGADLLGHRVLHAGRRRRGPAAVRRHPPSEDAVRYHVRRHAVCRRAGLLGGCLR